jgi:hypothetical protein
MLSDKVVEGRVRRGEGRNAARSWAGAVVRGLRNGRSLLVVAVVTLAFAIRYVGVPRVPLYSPPSSGDLAMMSLEAAQLLHGKWFWTGFANITVVGFLPPAFTMAIFGETPFGANMSNVIGGTLAVWLLYLLGRDAFGWWTGVLAAAILVGDFLAIHFSRIVTFADPVPWLIAALWLCVRFARERRWWQAVLASVAAALCLHVYFSGRVLIPILGLLAVLRPPLRRPVAIVGALTVAWCVPYLIYGCLHPSILTSRLDDILVWRPVVYEHMLEVYGVADWRALLRAHLWRTSALFWGGPRPMLPPLLQPFAVIGVGVGCWRWTRGWAALPLVWALSTHVLGSLVCKDPPMYFHLCPLFPALALLVATGFTTVLEQRFARGARVVLAPMALAMVVWVGVQNVRDYWHWGNTAVDQLTWLGHVMADTPPESRWCMWNGPRSFDESVLRWWSAPRATFTAASDADVARCVAEHRNWVVYLPAHERVIQALEQAHVPLRMEPMPYPNGEGGGPVLVWVLGP